MGKWGEWGDFKTGLSMGIKILKKLCFEVPPVPPLFAFNYHNRLLQILFQIYTPFRRLFDGYQTHN